MIRYRNRKKGASLTASVSSFLDMTGDWEKRQKYQAGSLEVNDMHNLVF
jgi:hypothetical protein